MRMAPAGLGMGLNCRPTQALVRGAAPADRTATVGSSVPLARSLGFALGPALASAAWGLAGGEDAVTAGLTLAAAARLYRRTPDRTARTQADARERDATDAAPPPAPLADESFPMCGTTGWASFHSDARTQAPVIEAMTAALTPCRPDAGGVCLDERAAICHRRLPGLHLAIKDEDIERIPAVLGRGTNHLPVGYDRRLTHRRTADRLRPHQPGPGPADPRPLTPGA
ncbi:hypothetical protein AB0D11_48500 [Streptomyces monashensis]|uniref:hypothetical protein n=1 Tax=Streptomyces monashensis TaxID=1678012 RepID=UPI0033ECDC7E